VTFAVRSSDALNHDDDIGTLTKQKPVDASGVHDAVNVEPVKLSGTTSTATVEAEVRTLKFASKTRTATTTAGLSDLTPEVETSTASKLDAGSACTDAETLVDEDDPSLACTTEVAPEPALTK
jgi:hypothetical protein